MTQAEEFPIGDAGAITGYHAHIYYAPETRALAARVRERIWDQFAPIEMGRFRDRAVGPHPVPMYQVAFGKDLFSQIVPWLLVNREGLTILVHPESGNAYKDHAHWPLWLGQKLDLDLGWLKRGNREG
jgi:aromatic ring-cleaving dioxygenase